jgi:hypothetical protein
MKKIFTLAVLLFATISYTSAQIQNQASIVTGKVISFEESLALEGVAVQVKGTNKNSGTQADGTFRISLSPDDKVLIFSIDGYQTQELQVTSQNDYEVVLKKSNSYDALLQKKYGLQLQQVTR